MRLSEISCLYPSLQRLKMEAPARLMIQSCSGTAPSGPLLGGVPGDEADPGRPRGGRLRPAGEDADLMALTWASSRER